MDLLKWNEYFLSFAASEKGLSKNTALFLGNDTKISEIKGIFDDKIKIGTDYKEYKVIGKIKNLNEYIIKNKIDRVIVAVREISSQKINFLQSVSSENDISLNFLPSIESFQNDPAKLNEHSGIPLISKNPGSQSFFYLLSKRLLDIIIVITITVKNTALGV